MECVWTSIYLATYIIMYLILRGHSETTVVISPSYFWIVSELILCGAQDVYATYNILKKHNYV